MTTSTATQTTAQLAQAIAALQLQLATLQDTAPDKFEPLQPGQPVVSLPAKNALTYKQAQHLCGELGLKANGKMDALLTRISRHDAGTATPEDYKKGKGLNKRAKKEKVAPRNAYGLDYRRAQRTVTWLKAQMPGVQLPLMVKNMGWDNVEANLTALLTTEWFTGLTEKQLRAMAKECVFTDEQFQAFATEVGI